MPYKIIHDHPECPKESGETGMDQVGGHAVVKEDDNTLMGCHKTHESAEDQITALNIAESEADEYNYMKKKKKKKRSDKTMSEIIYPDQNVVKSNNMDSKTELRTWSISDVEQKDDGDGLITFAGYASVFDYQYPVNDLRGTYLESVAPGAFRKTLSEQDDVKLLVNHEGIPLARTKSNTLDLTEDAKGLRVEAKLDPANPKVAEVASAMKRNDLNEMSFAFQAIKDDYNEQGDERVIREAKLYDVSIVTTPASDATTAKIRGVDIPGLQKALAEARSDGQVNTDVLLSTIDQLQSLLPQKQQQTVALAKRKLQMLDIKK
jgi:HK97 family phage prohead protease